MIRNWFRRRKDASNDNELADKKNCNSDGIDKDVIRAVALDTKIPDENKADYAKALDHEVKSQGLAGEKKNAYILAACALAAGGSLTYSNNAHAFCGGIQAKFERKLVNKLSKPFEDAVMGYVESATQAFDSIAEFGASTTGSSTTASTDAQNQVSTKIAENKVKAAAAPPPDSCGSDSNCARIQAASAKAPIKSAKLNTQMQMSMLADFDNAWSDYFKDRSRHAGYMDDSLNASFALRQKTGNDPVDANKRTDDFFMFTLGNMPTNDESHHLVSQMPDDEALYAYDKQQQIATATARQQIAVNALSQARAMHGSENEPGTIDTLREEVSRTYGSDATGWRKEVRDYADPTPGSIELALQLSLAGKIQVELLDSVKSQNLTLATKLLETIDNGATA